MVDLVTPDGNPADPSWLTNVGDSAPDPGVDLPDDSVSVTNPEGGEPNPSWPGDVGDSAPTPDRPELGDIIVMPDSGGGSTLGMIAIVVGAIALAAALLGGD